MNACSNRSVVLERAAHDAADVPNVLSIDPCEVPALMSGEVLIRSIYWSLDPAMYMWIRMAAPYMPIGPGDVLPSMIIGVVEDSKLEGFQPGDVVSTFGPMRERFVARASGGQEHSAGSGGVLSVTRIDHEPAVPLHLHLSLLSHIGHAAVGIRRIGRVAAGETVAVSAAAGATGSIAAQLAKSAGARVIGIAGGPQKCEWLTGTLGLDGAVDHRGDVAAQLAAVAPQGIDLFFDNVGGALLDTVLLHLAMRARVVVCGSLAQYGVAPEDRHRYANIDWLLQRNAKFLPFWISDYQEHLPEDMADLRKRYLDGSLIVKPPHIVQGIEAVPSALGLLLTGRNEGKLMVQVGPLPG